MNELEIKIPAKALLFGEYGVLNNGKAIAISFNHYFFHMSFRIENSEQNNAKINIISDFFRDKKVSFSTDELLKPSIQDSNILFFINLLQPWSNFLESKNLTIKIFNSYSPQLGFGSSSALIAGTSYAFNKLFLNDKEIFLNEDLWFKIRQSIKNIQQKGSGYDVAIQLAAIQTQSNVNNNVSFWQFQNKQYSVIPEVTKFTPTENTHSYGCFIKTNIYSDTKKAIQSFMSNMEKETFAHLQMQLVENFIMNSRLENVKQLMNKSLNLATLQKIIPDNSSSFRELQAKLEKENIAYKTMGAGHGDCIWTLATAQELTQNCKIPAQDIVFDFATAGALNE